MAGPELQSIVDALRAQQEPDTIEERRASMEALTGNAPMPGGVAVETVSAGAVPCEWVVMPGVEIDRALVYLHGGGYSMGSLNTHRRLAALMSAASGMRVLNVDYRLGPEHPYPAAVDDAVAAYHWLLGRDLDPGRVALAGDSAGGGLTAATLIALRDQGAPMPGGAVMISPWTDLALTSESLSTRADADPMCSRRKLKMHADLYLAGTDPRAPLASPVFADLHGLPALLIQVGDAEVLLDDSTTFAAKAKAAGVDVTLEVWPDMIHVFHAFAGLFPEAQQGVDRAGAWLRVHVE